MKWFSLFVLVMLLVVIAGCKASVPSKEDTSVTADTVQSVDNISSGLADVDSLESDVDLSDLDTLDQDLNI